MGGELFESRGVARTRRLRRGDEDEAVTPSNGNVFADLGFTDAEELAAKAWSNGQVEGQVQRLKLIKRTMYGRASFELLRRRVVDAA